jgi:hypothetical protein
MTMEIGMKEWPSAMDSTRDDLDPSVSNYPEEEICFVEETEHGTSEEDEITFIEEAGHHSRRNRNRNDSEGHVEDLARDYDYKDLPKGKSAWAEFIATNRIDGEHMTKIVQKREASVRFDDNAKKPGRNDVERQSISVEDLFTMNTDMELDHHDVQDEEDLGVPGRKPGRNEGYSIGNSTYEVKSWRQSASTRGHKDYDYRLDPSFKDLSKSMQYDMMAESGEVDTYPADSYSFISLHSPLKKPYFFFFGVMVFVFQILFLMYMILNKMSCQLGIKGEVDNPATDFLATFIPANVTNLVRATQITAVLSYVFFADSSLRDCTAAFELFPRFDRAHQGDQIWLGVFSCALRFSQGFLAIIASFLLIVTSDDVIDIILNFAAVNFISTLDETAFELAKWGKYGPVLENEARSIEQRPLPYCDYRKYKHVRYLFTIVPLAVMLVCGVVAVCILQEKHWVTGTFRVQFHDSHLEPYNGCYNIDSNTKHHKRTKYNSFENNTKQGAFGYCKDKRQWILFKVFKNDDDMRDPCEADRFDKLAVSGTTDYFDISSSFDDSWFSASGTPLDLFFFEAEEGLTEGGTDFQCGSSLNNGICDPFFNKLEYQFDGGDCCASTCTKPNCGQFRQGRSRDASAFGSNVTQGIGFPNCEDPSMKLVTISIDRIRSSRDPSILTVTESQKEEYERDKGIGFMNKTEATPFLNVDCNGHNVLSIYINNTMNKTTETIHVEDGARCEISVSSTANFYTDWDDDPIWLVDYTVYHGNDTVNEIVSGHSRNQSTISFHRIMDCYFDKLEEFIENSTAYDLSIVSNMALDWLINDESGNSKCEDDFLVERFALANMNFAAPMHSTISYDYTTSNSSIQNTYLQSANQCRWENIACDNGSVKTLSVRRQNLTGSISTSVGLLTELRRIDYGAKYESEYDRIAYGNIMW